MFVCCCHLVENFVDVFLKLIDGGGGGFMYFVDEGCGWVLMFWKLEKFVCVTVYFVSEVVVG